MRDSHPRTRDVEHPGRVPATAVMNTLYLLVGIDTEPDTPWEGRSPTRPTFANLHALPALHERFTRYGVRPTYLVTHPVVTDPSTAEVIHRLQALGQCEIGVCHDPRHAIPYAPDADLALDGTDGAATARFAEQLEQLTDAVEAVTSIRPTSYRAREGFGASHVSILERHGYNVGSTVTPWRAGPRGATFVGAPLTPYYLSYDDVRQPGSSDVLEIPVTCVWNRHLPAWLASPLAHLTRHSVGERLLRSLRAAHLIELRPSSSSLGDMIHVARQLVREPPHILNIVCTSSDGVVGGTPTSVSDAHLDQFFDRLESFLRFVTDELDAVPLTFQEFRAHWCSPSIEPWRSAAVRAGQRTTPVASVR